MRCDRCGGDSHVLETRESKNFIITRRRECKHCGHRFMTRESHAASCIAHSRRAGDFASAANNRINLRRRDIQIYDSLHLGWRHLSQLHKLSKAAIYLAAARGRKYREKERNAHSS